jgi:hypothetical protein
MIAKIKIVAVPLIFMPIISCSTDHGSSSSAATSTATSTASATSAGNCVVAKGEGCIGGFISHGSALTVSLVESNEDTKFRDAADLFDRFGEAFIEPSIKADDRNPDDYEITLEPEVKRDNFAIGFYQFLEGTKAYDKKTISAEGNFSYSPIDSGTYLYRMVKEITLVQKPKDGGEPLEQCLVFEHQKENVVIDVDDQALQIHQLGGIKEFEFYVRRNYGKCSGSKELPPIGPKVIDGNTETETSTATSTGTSTTTATETATGTTTSTTTATSTDTGQ